MNNLNDLINFILNAQQANMVNIPDEFMGDEQTTKTTINKLSRLGLVTDNNANYKIQVKANIVELELLRDTFNYNLEKYEKRNNISHNELHIIGDVIGSQLSQGSSLGDLNNQSPTEKNIAQQAHPKQNEVKKHGFWDKVKYISGIIAGIIGLKQCL